MTPRARVALGGTVSSQVLRPAGASFHKTRHGQQTRAFRFGISSSYFDPEFHKELRRCYQRAVKLNINESLLAKKLSWKEYSITKDPKEALKRIIEKHTLSEAQSRPRFIDSDFSAIFNGSSKKHDTEGSQTQKPSQQSTWFNSPLKSQVGEIISQWTKQDAKGARQAKSDFGVSRSQSKDDPEDFVIDPITNRKVPRNADKSLGKEPEAPVPTFKSYRSQFATFAPPDLRDERPMVHSNGPPPADELKKYEQIDISSDPASASVANQTPTAASPDELRAYETPTTQNEQYSLNHLPPDEPIETYDDLHKYKPYTYNEPNGVVEEESAKYDDLHKYGPYMHNENVTTEESASKYDDLHKYGPFMYNENVKTEEPFPKYDDLAKYGPFMYREEMKAGNSPKDEELRRYGPFMYREHDMKSQESSPKYSDLDKYNPTALKDSIPTTNDQPFSQYGDLEHYKMFRYQEPDGKPTVEKDAVAESLKEYDAKTDESETKDSKPSIAERLQKLRLTGEKSQSRTDQSLKIKMPNLKTESRDDLERAMDSHREASDAADREAHANIQKLRARMRDQAKKSSKPPMTGNYVKDFPEDFVQSWAGYAASQPFGPKDLSGSTSPSTLAKYKGSSRLETALDRQNIVSKLEPALDRQSKATKDTLLSHRAREEAEADHYSKEPQGLETSYMEECGGKPTWPTFVKTYSANPGVDSKETKSMMSNTTTDLRDQAPGSAYSRDPEIDGLPREDTLEAATLPEREPTVYKILAYDPTTKSVNTAETTSVVPDEAAPMTPADALLRLSQPTKFLPHLAPLQAEGFEIASGGGDILVFRQVRSPSSTTARHKSRFHQDANEPPINPIDMMGRRTPAPLPSAAAFASPTGFVNYDLPPTVEVAEDAATAKMATAPTTTTTTTTTPPFRSGIEVRREEPVFSGPKTRIIGAHKAGKVKKNEDRKRERAGIGRRMLVAGAWVAAISYSLGVMGEYFITGGIDGKGPTGF